VTETGPSRRARVPPSASTEQTPERRQVISPRYATRTPPRVGNDIPSRCFDSTTRHLEGSVRTSAQLGEAITRPERARSNGPHAFGQPRCFRRVSLWDGLPGLGTGSYESPGARLSRRVLWQARTTPPADDLDPCPPRGEAPEWPDCEQTSTNAGQPASCCPRAVTNGQQRPTAVRQGAGHTQVSRYHQAR
jgi:hypothetical protein